MATANKQYPFVSTLLGSQLFIFPREALRGTWGTDDLKSVLTNKFFDTDITGVAVTAQAAQTMAASGTVATAAVTGTATTAQAAHTMAASGTNGSVTPPVPVPVPEREPHYIIWLPSDMSKFKPLPARMRIRTRQEEQAVVAAGGVKEKITGRAETSHEIISMVRAKGHKNTFRNDIRILRMIWDIEDAA